MSGKRFRGHVHKVLDPRTIAVQVIMTKYHPLYKISYTQKRKFLVDKDPATSVLPGQDVYIVSCPRVSKTKAYRLTPDPKLTVVRVDVAHKLSEGALL